MSNLPIDAADIADDYELSALDLFGVDKNTRPQLAIDKDEEPPCISVFYVAFDNSSIDAQLSPKEATSDKVLLAEIFSDYIVTYPIHVRRDKPDYLQSKYGKIRSIVFDSNDFFPETVEEVEGLFDSFPDGFSKQFQYGLGLKWEYRFLMNRIADIEEVNHVVFSETEVTRVEGDCYYFNLNDYQNLRKAINKITRQYQHDALEDKLFLTYSNILVRHDPKKFPVKTKKLKPGTIYNIVNTGGRPQKLDRNDQKSAIRLVENNKEELAKDHPEALLKLKADIEHVTLSQLTVKYEEMLAKDLTEAVWQQFFKDNAFVLSLAFSYPVMLVQDQAHVGGADIRGIGNKIADFLVANRFTGNLGLFEIKRPSTPLLKEVKYRVNLFQNSSELSGSIAQVQDQKFQLHKYFTAIKDASDWHDYDVFSVDCIVIIGRNPQDRHQKKSFELSRQSLMDVHVITYDELLEKLKQLQRLFLAGKSKTSETGAPASDDDSLF